MALLERACGGLLRALSSAACSQTVAAAQCQSLRAFSTPIEPVPPAVTSRDISEEWYLRQRNTVTLGNRTPHAAVGVWIAPSAVVVGDVDLYDRVSIWDGCVLRGDLNNITIGQVSNIQDRTVIHAARTSPTGLTAATLIGEYVTVQPGCMLRSCRVQDFCLVGARSVLLEGSMMESKSVLGPGSVLPPARRVPSGELWAGNPARFVRKLTEDEMDLFVDRCDEVRKAAWALMSDELPHGTAWRVVEAMRKEQEQDDGEFVDVRRAKYKARVEKEKAASDKDVYRTHQ